MRYYLRGPITIAGAITTGCGVILLLIVLIVLAVESRPMWAWLLALALLLPVLVGGLLIWRVGLKVLTTDATGMELRMPGGRPQRVDYANMRVVTPQESWFARMNLILVPDVIDASRRTARIAIPRNVSVFPQILAELKQRAPEVREKMRPTLPIIADRRLEFTILMMLGNFTLIPMFALMWWNTDVAAMSSGDLAVGAGVTLLVVGSLVGACLHAMTTITCVEFRRESVVARAMVGVRLQSPANRIRGIEVRRQERSVRGMRYFEDDLILTDAAGVEHTLPLRLIQSARVAPRELAARLGEAWDLAVRETEYALYANPPGDQRNAR